MRMSITPPPQQHPPNPPSLPCGAPGGDGLAVEDHHMEEGVEEQDRVGADAALA